MQLCLQIKHWRGGEFIRGKVLRQEQLPVEMLVCLLRQFARSHSHQADVCVVDCFCGTGSTAVAALALGTIETASKYLASDWGSLFFFLSMALFLAWRPQGLLVARRS